MWKAVTFLASKVRSERPGGENMRGKTFAAWVGAVSLALGAFGCGGDSGSGGTEGPAKGSRSSFSRDLSPDVPVEDLAAAAGRSGELGLDLLTSTPGNAVVAPFSASVSLARLRAGAASDTRAALDQAVGLTLAAADADEAFNALDLGVSSRVSACTLGDETSTEAAQGWSQARYGYLRTWLDRMAESYGVKPVNLDFAAAPTDAWYAYEAWAQATGAINGESVACTEDTRLVLADAERLNAAWVEPFDPGATALGWFELAPGDDVRVPFLRRTGPVAQARGEGYLAFELPLTGGDLRFLVILPDSGRFAEVAAALTPNSLTDIARRLEPGLLELALPRFAVSAQGSLLTPDILGLGPASTRDVADFSGIDGTRDLYLSAFGHAARLAVGEAGVRAGALTTLALDDAHPEIWTDPGGTGYGLDLMASFMVPTHPIVIPIKIGRPFFFALRDAPTGTVLYLGRVVNPDPLAPVTHE